VSHSLDLVLIFYPIFVGIPIPDYIQACTPEPAEPIMNTSPNNLEEKSHSRGFQAERPQRKDQEGQLTTLLNLEPSAESSCVTRQSVPSLHPSANPAEPFIFTGGWTEPNPVSIDIYLSRYRQVNVLLLGWEDDTGGGSNMGELNVLAKNFKDLFNFRTETWKIPNEHSHLKVYSKLLDFVVGAKNYDLLIVHYYGEGKLSKDMQLTWSRYV
jgi:hypothetical protein